MASWTRVVSFVATDGIRPGFLQFYLRSIAGSRVRDDDAMAKLWFPLHRYCSCCARIDRYSCKCWSIARNVNNIARRHAVEHEMASILPLPFERRLVAGRLGRTSLLFSFWEYIRATSQLRIYVLQKSNGYRCQMRVFVYEEGLFHPFFKIHFYWIKSKV